MANNKLWLKNEQRAQRNNLKRIAKLQPSSAPGRAIQWGSGEAHRDLTSHTPWRTGALRAARRIKLDTSIPRAVITNDPGARNPTSKTSPAEYDAYLHNRGEIPGLRGGFMASFPYTVRVNGPRIARIMARMVIDELRTIK